MKELVLVVFLLALTLVASAQEKGKASYYADKFEGKKTANGEVYQHYLKTAAHKTLPFGTHVKVTNTSNNKTVIVKINDRGPFVKGRIIDLSKSAALKLGGVRQGIIEVTLEIIEPAK